MSEPSCPDAVAHIIQDLLYNQIVAMRNRFRDRVNDFTAAKSQDINFACDCVFITAY